MTAPDPLLQAQTIHVSYRERGGWLRPVLRPAAVDGVDLSVDAGETVGLVGESGSGKSSLARALLRLIRPAVARVRGAVRFRGHDLLSMPAADLREQREHLQLVFQDPLAALNPRMTVGDILQEPLKIFAPSLDALQRREQVASMLDKVGLDASAASRFPRQFSGGQCQRIGIARAMMRNPDLLICDEPVSALDVSIQGQIVNLLTDMQAEHGMAMIFISHNLAIVRHLSRRIYVMYRGRIVETGACAEVLSAPRHPYTRLLIATLSPLNGRPADEPETVQIDVRGCAFRQRCPHALPLCAEAVPDLIPVSPGHAVACRRHAEI